MASAGMALWPSAHGFGQAAPAPASESRLEMEALLHDYRPGVFAFLRRKGFTYEEADDLTQETLIRAYQHLSGFRGLSMAAWLYRIASNVAVDHLRKQRVTLLPLEQVAQVPSDEEDLVARLDADAKGASLRAVIARLPQCHQRILQLRYFEDRSLAEIAAAMNCSPMAAKLRVFRAVTALRKSWRGGAPEAARWGD